MWTEYVITIKSKDKWSETIENGVKNNPPKKTAMVDVNKIKECWDEK